MEASIEMHAQMSALSTLVTILGYIPKVTVN
ncbi:transcriptional repressor TraM [Sinorhizobium sp. 7-81]